MIKNIFFDIGNVLLKFDPLASLEQSVAPIAPNISLLKKLSKGYNLFSLTDASPEQLAYEVKTFPFFSLFQEIINAKVEGYSKSDPLVYRFTAERLHVTPTSCLFIDDKKENVQAAAQANFHTLHYTTTKACLAKLTTLKINLSYP